MERRYQNSVMGSKHYQDEKKYHLVTKNNEVILTLSDWSIIRLRRNIIYFT